MGAAEWAVLSAAFCAIGIVLQQKGAMAAPPAGSKGFIGALIKKPVWLAGLGGQILAWVTQALALDKGELIVVQPILSLQVVFALPLGIWLTHQDVGKREWLGAVVVIVGLAVFLTVSNPTEGRSVVPALVWAVATAIIVVVVGALALVGWHRRPAERAAMLGVAAGVLFGFQAAAMKSFDTVVPGGLSAMATSWSSYAMLLSAIGGFYLVQTSLQTGALAPSIAASNAANPLASALLGRTVFLETPQRTTGGRIASIASLGLLVLGIIWLARGEAATGGQPQSAPRVPEHS